MHACVLMMETRRRRRATPQCGHLRTMEHGRMEMRENEETKVPPWCN